MAKIKIGISWRSKNETYGIDKSIRKISIGNNLSIDTYASHSNVSNDSQIYLLKVQVCTFLHFFS